MEFDLIKEKTVGLLRGLAPLIYDIEWRNYFNVNPSLQRFFSGFFHTSCYLTYIDMPTLLKKEKA